MRKFLVILLSLVVFSAAVESMAFAPSHDLMSFNFVEVQGAELFKFLNWRKQYLQINLAMQRNQKGDKEVILLYESKIKKIDAITQEMKKAKTLEFLGVCPDVSITYRDENYTRVVDMPIDWQIVDNILISYIAFLTRLENLYEKEYGILQSQNTSQAELLKLQNVIEEIGAAKSSHERAREDLLKAEKVEFNSLHLIFVINDSIEECEI